MAAGSGDDRLESRPVASRGKALTLPLVSLYDSRMLTQEDRWEVTSNPDEEFGESLGVGDFNGDGVADLAVGSTGKGLNNGPYAGVLMPFKGSGGGPTQAAYTVIDENVSGGADETADRFSAAIATGDFNGDGIADIAVGAPGKKVGGLAGAGVVYVYFGSENFPLPQGTETEAMGGQTAAAGDQFGTALAIGDFNGDGFDDLAVGASGKAVGGAGGAGMVFVYPGSPDGLSTGTAFSSSAVAHAPGAGDGFGSALAAGDLDGDGLMDLAVGVPGRKISGAVGAGAVAVVRGTMGGLSGGSWVTQEQDSRTSETGDQFGFALAVADLDGDAVSDLVVGAPGESLGSATSAGMVCTFTGGAIVPGAGECVTASSAGAVAETGARFGHSLDAGDLNSDGFSDVVVGSPGSGLGGAAGAGALFFFAGTTGALSPAGFVVQEDVGQSSEAGDALGFHVAIGDMDGDGSADVAAGAPIDTGLPGIHSGTVFIFPGLAQQSRVKVGPLVGAVSSTSARLWARADRPSSLAFEYRLAGAPWPGVTASPLSLGTGTDLAGSILIEGLAPDTAYEYRAQLDGQVQVGSEGSFRTLPAPGVPSPIAFALGADLHYGNDPYPILDHIGSHAPAFTLFVGDQIYADEPTWARPTPWDYGRKYRENWAEPHFAGFTRDNPSFMIWDDHEIFDNWDQGTSGRYVPGRAAYDNYQGSHNPAPRVSGEIYYAFTAGQAGFYVMDTRTYRSAESDPDGPGKTMLGAIQKLNLKIWLSTSTDRFKFLVSSVMWNDHGTTGNDTWTGYQTERLEIFNYIRTNHICGVVLLSGDQHWTGVFTLNQASPRVLYELSPTPIGTFPRQKTDDTTSDILFKYDDSRVYGLVTVDPVFPQGRVLWDVFNDDADQIIHHMELDWPALCPDSDGDTVLDDADCRPDDATLWEIPGEVTLNWQNGTTIGWSAPASSGGTGAASYDLLVSTSKSDFTSAAATCLATNTQALTAIDATVPSTDQALYYLVRAENACGGTLGSTSSGVPRAGRSCP
jgi:phosphodiesterase/alkaline phosphatase D-like protein